MADNCGGVSRRAFLNTLGAIAGSSLALGGVLSIVEAAGKQQRILIVGESILNSSYIVARLRAATHGTPAELWTYGGSFSPMGLLLLSNDIQVWQPRGNLLHSSDLSRWGLKYGVQVTGTRSPTTGRPTQKIVAMGKDEERLTGTRDNGSITVPVGAPPLIYSIEIEPGSLKSFRLLVYNLTKRATVAQRDFAQDDVLEHAYAPTRYVLAMQPTDGGGYHAGDVLTCYLYVGQAEGYRRGYIYARNPAVIPGMVPAPYLHTGGRPQAVHAAQWVKRRPDEHRQLFHDVVIQFGRNDADGNISAAQHTDMISAMIDSAAAFAQRVLVCTPPPLALADLSAFSPADPYVKGGYLDAVARATVAAGAQFYDAVTDFKTQVEGGKATVHDLMRDNAHPTDTPTSAGMGLYVNAIARAFSASASRPHHTGIRVIARVGGQPEKGAWQWRRFLSGTPPRLDPHGLLFGVGHDGDVAAITSSEPGATLRFDVVGSDIGLIWLEDARIGGSAEVRIDGKPVKRLHFKEAGGLMYPHATFVAGGLPHGPHMVQVIVVSGEVRMIGVAAV